MTLQLKASLRRFIKATFAAGVAQIALLAASGIQINSLEDLKKLGYALASAFVAGALMGVDKFLNWNDQPNPVLLPISEEETEKL